MKNKIALTGLLILLAGNLCWACFFIATFCSEATLVNNERIVVGTITSSSTNSVDFNIINVLYGTENNTTITIWDGATIECTGYWPNNANDMGNIGDTILCLIEPITAIENSWDVIGDYRRPSLLGGYALYTNFSAGYLFENTYTFDDVLTLDIADFCCNNLNGLVSVTIPGLPSTTGSTQPITLSGYPAGGIFSGPGVTFNSFNPVLAGPGNHTITYTFTEEFGCSFSTQQDIFVFTITYNFDLSGKQYYQKAVQFNAGIHLHKIQLDQKLPKGIYLFKVTNSKSYTSKKIIVSG